MVAPLVNCFLPDDLQRFGAMVECNFNNQRTTCLVKNHSDDLPIVFSATEAFLVLRQNNGNQLGGSLHCSPHLHAFPLAPCCFVGLVQLQLHSSSAYEVLNPS